MKQRKLEELMTTKVITIHPKDKISKAIQLMERYNIHHLPVCINAKVVGIVSHGDLMVAGKKLELHQDKFPHQTDFTLNSIDEIMTINPITIEYEDGLETALKLMVERRINCIPVIKDENIIGILTAYDVIDDYLKCYK